MCVYVYVGECGHACVEVHPVCYSTCERAISVVCACMCACVRVCMCASACLYPLALLGAGEAERAGEAASAMPGAIPCLDSERVGGSLFSLGVLLLLLLVLLLLGEERAVVGVDVALLCAGECMDGGERANERISSLTPWFFNLNLEQVTDENRQRLLLLRILFFFHVIIDIVVVVIT